MLFDAHVLFIFLAGKRNCLNRENSNRIQCRIGKCIVFIPDNMLHQSGQPMPFFFPAYRKMHMSYTDHTSISRSERARCCARAQPIAAVHLKAYCLTVRGNVVQKFILASFSRAMKPKTPIPTRFLKAEVHRHNINALRINKSDTANLARPNDCGNIFRIGHCPLCPTHIQASARNASKIACERAAAMERNFGYSIVASPVALSEIARSTANGVRLT